jgi:hypothetical protein
MRSVVIDFEGDVVHDLREMGQQLGNRAPALPIGLERPRACHHFLGAVDPAALDLKRRGLAVIFLERRLRVEHIDRAGPAADVDEDDVFGFGSKVRSLRSQIVDHPRRDFRSKRAVALHHPARRQSAEAACCLSQGFSACQKSLHHDSPLAPDGSFLDSVKPFLNPSAAQ